MECTSNTIKLAVYTVDITLGVEECYAHRNYVIQCNTLFGTPILLYCSIGTYNIHACMQV